MDFQKLIGENIRRARLAANLSQEELARKLRDGEPDQWYDQAYISRLENGHWDVKVMTLWRIARALNVTVAQLVSETSSTTRK